MANESRKRLWPDEDEWLDFFREYLCGHPELGEHVARIWFALIEHLGQGPEGVRDARFILKQAMRLTYPFTRSYRLAYRHYLLSLTGQVKPEDEPEHLLKASIARAKAQIAEARKLKTGETGEE
jgi:hypothetical protein